MEENKRISVIVTAYDHHELTTVHVRESMNSDTTPDEIVVINDGGTDDLRDKLMALDKKCPIVYAKIIEDIPWNYNGACNLAVWLSKGDYLAFEDNDNIPSRPFYTEALQLLKDNPKVGRVIAGNRKDVEDVFIPFDEWKVIGKRGANMGTGMLLRLAYLKAKGQDGRFCGRYGWMYYDWRSRLLGPVGIEFGAVGDYYYCTSGQSNLTRGNNPQNFGYYRENARNHAMQPPGGILNFHYEYETLN